jgi:hypothetical protein
MSLGGGPPGERGEAMRGIEAIRFACSLGEGIADDLRLEGVDEHGARALR